MPDPVEVAKIAIAALGFPAALITAFKAIDEIRSGNKEREQENRLKQAAAAKDTLKDLFGSVKARAAMQMIDWSGRSYQDGAQTHVVEWGDLRPALRAVNSQFTDQERFIRDYFEEFFDQIQLMQHYVSIGFLHYHDLSVPLSYYARIIVKHMGSFEPFLDGYGYPEAKSFIQRAAN